METEIRFYYSINSYDKIVTYLKKFSELNYIGRFYECTDQYNHPMRKYDFYSKKIDGRFRVRRTIGNNESKCMITWKRRIDKTQVIHNEEEVEVSININEYEKLLFLLNDVLHLSLVESYERYRTVFNNNDVEIVVDEYPFGVCVEIENKNLDKDGCDVVREYVSKLNFNINDAYNLSWDDKYLELCSSQNKKVYNIVRFNMDMPKIDVEFNLK